MWMVLVDALGMVRAGLAVGAPLAFWGRRVAGSLTANLPGGSLALIVSGTGAMVVGALLAAYLTARRPFAWILWKLCDRSSVPLQPFAPDVGAIVHSFEVYKTHCRVGFVDCPG
jgi:hypothetical protein